MLVDRRKDNYDELMLLSRDSRERRKRVNRWTTALVAGGMAVSAAYVASTGKQVDALQDQVAKMQQIQHENALLIAERNKVKAERDIFARQVELVASAVPDLELAEGLRGLASAIGGSGGTGGSGSSGRDGEDGEDGVIIRETTVGMSDVVWLVDGSRRFPMAENDYLWIPEAGTWIQLQSIAGGTVQVFTGDRSAGGEEVALGDGYHQLQIPGPLPGASNYACLSLTSPSTRPGFQTGRYADLEILFLSAPCPPSE